jgi:glycosyltransferase involved in cell wall biosynthesis
MSVPTPNRFGIDRLSIVVPVYNSSGSLRELIRRLTVELPKLAPSYEIVLVNDGSRDDSWAVAAELARSAEGVIALDLHRNYGQHNALLAGIREASGDVVVTLDDDLQHPPEEIPKLLAKLAEGYDVVYGVPNREHHGLWRRAAARVTKVAMRTAMRLDVASSVSAFRAFRTPLREAFVDYRGPWVEIDVLLTWGTTKFSVVAVEHKARAVGKSNYTFLTLARHALNLVTGFSTWPLRLASIAGFTFTLFGLGVLVYVLSYYFARGHTVPGFAFLASVIAIFGGVQLFALGIMGEYLARMHLRIADQPPYVVRDRVGVGSGG